jgi:hypothetical protein
LGRVRTWKQKDGVEYGLKTIRDALEAQK